MLHSVISSFVLCFLLFLCYEQVVCLPLKDNKNTTRLLISRRNLLNETTGKKLNVILSRRKKLTYEDLPDDGSLDEEFERLQAQESTGEQTVELDNTVYFQGDIKLDPLTKLYMEVDRNLPPRRKRAVASNPNMRWINRTIPYTIDRSLPGKTKFVIRQAIRHWKSNTCLRFRRKRISDVDYINFYDDGDACWSRVGRIGGKQNISIAKHCATRGVVVHEIGHAVGFYHEQARRDRDQYIEIIKKNIDRRDVEQFRRMSHSLVTSMGFAYDYWSIMHYGRTAFSKNRKDTIRIKKIGRRVKAEIGRRVLSRLDIAQLREMYKCNPLPSYEARKGCFRSRKGDGREYRGTLDYTETGITCQHWSDNYPHSHKKKLHKNGLGIHNYCRNPGGRRQKPWCFTTKTRERWQYCDVRICSN